MQKQNKLTLHIIQTNIEMEKLMRQMDFINSTRIENFVTLEGIKTDILYNNNILEDALFVNISFSKESDSIMVNIKTKKEYETDFIEFLKGCNFVQSTIYTKTSEYLEINIYLRDILNDRYGFDEKVIEQLEERFLVEELDK